MNIQLLNLQLRNFKGVQNLNVEFGNITNITGDNGTGKTTVFDAFTWLLFGKNSEDAKDFNIKTLDANNQPLHRLEHEVIANMNVNGRVMKFRRMLKEKWVKKRGEETPEFTGHETEFSVDDVPLSQKEYQARVDYVMNESIAKMITNPLYFNSLKWQDRRTVLEKMAGTISNADIAGNNVHFIDLLKEIGNEAFTDFKKRLTARRLKIKETLDLIPTRIDEAERGKPTGVYFEALRVELESVEARIKGIDAQLESSAQAYELENRRIRDLQQKKHTLQMQQADAKQKTGSEKRRKLAELKLLIDGVTTDKGSLIRNITTTNVSIKNNDARVQKLTERNNEIRALWNKKNAEVLVIDEHALTCPTCLQALPAEQQSNTRETLTANFNKSKQAALSNYSTEGKNNAAEIERLNKETATLKQQLEEWQTEMTTLETKLFNYEKDVEIVNGWAEAEAPEVAELQQQIDAIVIPDAPLVDNEGLKEQKQQLQFKLNSINQQLAQQSLIEKANARIAELEAEEKKLAQEVANIERTEFILAGFTKARIEAIEARINGKFKLVKFKMFEQQVNGGEVDCCECMVNGVPYADLNTATKINAGIDIINALTEHYQINAPVFIDNRESVIRLLPCKSQIINLVAVKDAKLNVQVEQPFAVASN